jgi:two-component system chemotaxis sensor kinase CheA
MARDPYKYFRIEARDLLDQFAQGALDLEKGGGRAQIARLLRVAHTLKGAARVVKENGIAESSHAIEDVLIPWRDSDEQVPRAEIDRILAEIDRAESRLKELAPPPDEASAPKPGAVPATSAAPAAAAEEPALSVRAELTEVDTLLDGLAETHALLSGLRGATDTLEQGRHLADLLVAQLSPRPETVLSGPQKHLFTLADELRRKLSGADRLLDQSLGQMDRELTQLRDTTEQMRLIAAGSLFTGLERAVRDGARALGRLAEFVGEGGDVRLDAPVIEAVQHALVQMVRNAVAHGIESPAERRAKGKPEEGRVRLRVARRGRRIVFECSDDGRGLDFEAIRRAGAAPLASDEEAVRLLLKGGISTSEQVTEAAGRGVGMDVVRDVAQRLGGSLDVRSEAGHGTVFELTVPSSLSAVDSLLVESSGVVSCLPLDSVRGCLRLNPEDFADTGHGLAIRHEEIAVPFLPLAELIAAPRPADETRWTAVVVAGRDGLAAVGINRLLGTGRVVVHPLPDEAPTEDIVAGASLDAEGNPRLMLDPDRLVAAVGRASGSLAREAKALPMILVVDDSLTTQMLQRSILESAGYPVDVAGSAEIGLDMAKAGDYGLFLVDVEMPGMDGFSFIERIRADPVLYRVPAILVTSRAAPEDLQRGREAGAQGYMIKSAFDQSELLAMIRRLTE